MVLCKFHQFQFRNLGPLANKYSEPVKTDPSPSNGYTVLVLSTYTGIDGYLTLSGNLKLHFIIV